MKLDKIFTLARSEYGFSDAEKCTRIYISALKNTPALPDISGLLMEETGRQQIPAEVINAGSYGYYDLEPVIRIEKPGMPPVLLGNVSPENIAAIVNEYLVNGKPVEGITFESTGEKKFDSIPDISESSLFSLQKRVALRNCGRIDPENISHSILDGQGYSGLAEALEMTPSEVIAVVKKSGLRGKSEAGYFTGEKWRICNGATGDEKYVICNAVDTDQDSLTARLLLESDPHSVLEGILIAAYAVSASKCYVCVNSKNSTGRERLERALEQAGKYGLTGRNILDSEFGTDIEIIEMDDTLISGEETVLIRSIEGKQPIPYLRTVYPAIEGINNRPTLINSLETLSCISAVFQNSAEWYADTGTEKSRGTKIITLSGNIAHKYTVEVPLGTKLDTIINDIGGGTTDGKSIKAVRVGGPTGGYITSSSLDIPLDFESMEKNGTVIGSGVIRIIDETACALEMVKDTYDYLQSQSCGKCVFCREGTIQIVAILADISEGKSKPGDMDLLTGLCEAMKEGCICNLGANAPDPLLSSIRLFAGDFETHIKDKKCPVRGEK